MTRDPDITSPQNARVKALVKLRDQRGRRKAGLFIAEGWRAVERAAAAGLNIQSIYLCEGGLPLSTPRDQVREQLAEHLPDSTKQRTIEFVTVSPAVFRKIAYVREPEGILAVCEPPAWSVDALSPTGASTLDLVAVGTEKPGNLGAMVRTADLAGCRCVIAAGTPVDAMNPNAIRASTGAVFSLPTIALPEADAIDYLVSQKVRVISAVVDGSIEHAQADFTAGPCAIVVGPEDRGLSAAWRQASEATGGAAVRIAMAGRCADSLNASVAAGVLLFEAARQRRLAGLQ